MQSPANSHNPGLTLPRALFDQMLSHVKNCLPEEACGILGGRCETVQMVLAVENELHSPVRFRMRGEDQLRAFLAVEEAGLELSAIWHSHPTGPERLSATDLAEAYYPEAILLVLSPEANSPGGWLLRGFRVSGGQAEDAPVQVV